MHRITLRRTFNIGNYESISAEATGEHEDQNQARLLASKLVLEAVQQELIRILNIRASNVHSNPWDQVLMELNGVNSEFNSH